MVPRFVCQECGRHFSEQTFRANYRHKLPKLNLTLFPLLISKVTHRQAARILGVNKTTVARRIPRLGSVSRAVHEHLAARRTDGALLDNRYLLDELETYAESRRNNPLTVPVIIHEGSFFVVHTEVGPLPRRGGTGRDEAPPIELTDEQRAARNRGSSDAVESCCERLARFVPVEGTVAVGSDDKHSYKRLFSEALPERLEHRTTSSKDRRDWRNPLFRINLTLAMMRDGVSRLVRRTWAASKLEERLRDHLWVWAVWRNYVRGMTNKTRFTTPAMALGICGDPLDPARLFEWRALFVPLLFRL